MKALELFTGKWLGFGEIVSLDFLSKFNSTIMADILEWDYKAAYSPGYFDFVWALPDYTSWSIATPHTVSYSRWSHCSCS